MLKTIYAEVAELFPDDYVHIGGDEMRSCFFRDAGVQQRLREQGMSASSAINKLLATGIAELRARGKTPIAWEACCSARWSLLCLREDRCVPRRRISMRTTL